MRKQYIVPKQSIELLEPAQTILFVSGSDDDKDYIGGLDPTKKAPKRIGGLYI